MHLKMHIKNMYELFYIIIILNSNLYNEINFFF